VAAVVALADDHAHRAPSSHLGSHAGQPAAGPFHQVERRDADLPDRPPVGGAHLARLVELVEPVGEPTHRSKATAPATESVCVSDTVGCTPSSGARGAARPARRTLGGPFPATTSTSRSPP